MPISSAEDFHNAIHSTVGTPQLGVKTVHIGKVATRKTFSRAHTFNWASTRVNLICKIINIDIYIDFQQNSLSTADYTRLKSLSIKGIQHYWSRNITLSGSQYTVIVKVHQRKTHSVGVDLYIENSKDYARSYNTGLFDASFFYNAGFFKGLPSLADKDFMLVSAHEFGHSVLMDFGGIGLSWRHKGSTTLLTQTFKSSTPGYPAHGAIDLMRYYNAKKNKQFVSYSSIYKRSIAAEIDVKRLIWLSQITIK